MKPNLHSADEGLIRHVGVRSILGTVRLFEWVALLSAVGAAVFFTVAPVTMAYFRLALWTLRDMSILAGISVVMIVVGSVPKLLRSGSRWREAINGLELAQRRFWVDMVRIVVAFSVVETVHLTIKTYVPVINHTNHDGLLWRIDHLLGFGHDPVSVALSVFGQPFSLHVIDLVYSGLYYLFLWGGVVVFMVGLDRERRLAFFDSFLLMWQIGLVIYILLPTWGPVFTRPELFEIALQSCPMTTHVQSALEAETSAIFRGNYNVVIQFFGLAAFPSLHVAVFALFALWGGAIARWWRWWNTAMLFVVFVGSMVTGYHYLADGLAGVLIAAGCVAIARRGLSGAAGAEDISPSATTADTSSLPSPPISARTLHGASYIG